MNLQGTASAVAALLCVLLPLATVAQPLEAADSSVYDRTIPVRTTQPDTTVREVDNTQFGFVLGLDGEFGGDDFVTIFYTDGSDQDISTGNGITAAAGVHFHTAGHWDFRGTVGYKYSTTKAEDAHLYFERIVFKAAADYFFADKWFLGAGVVHHTGMKFHTDGLGPNIKFDDATGYTIEAGWSFISLNYTFIDYKDDLGSKFDANTIGISFTGRF